MQYGIINYSHHALYYILLGYFITRNVYLLTPFTHHTSNYVSEQLLKYYVVN